MERTNKRLMRVINAIQIALAKRPVMGDTATLDAIEELIMEAGFNPPQVRSHIADESGVMDEIITDETIRDLEAHLTKIETVLASGTRLYSDIEDAIPWLIDIAHRYIDLLKETD